MTKPLSEETVRSSVVDYWQGELSDMQALAIEEHLQTHPETAAFYERMKQALDAASELPVDEWVAERSHRVWQSIEQELPQVERTRHRRPAALPIWGGIGIAAAAAVALVTWFAQQPETVHPVAVAGPQQDVVDVPMSLDASIADAPWSFEPVFSSNSEVRMLASSGALYTSPEPREIDLREMRIDSGTVVVEFVSGHGRRLRVVTPDARIDVTGTIFYVSVNDGATSVGVIEGEVQVHRKTKPSVTLHRRSKLSAEQQVDNVDDALVNAIGEHIDVGRHNEKILRAAERRRNGPDKSTDLTAQARPASKRALAREALWKGDYGAAAALFEAAIRQAPPGESSAAYLRLDAARLYSRHLKQSGKAAVHLRAFVKTWPSHRMAPFARERLCAIEGKSSAFCDSK